MLKKLQKYFSKKIISPLSLNKFLKDNKDIQLQLYKIYKLYQNRFDFYHFVKFYIKQICDKKCLNCGKLLTQKQLNSNRIQFCSLKCMSNSDVTKQKRKNTIIEKYGVQNPLQSQQIKQKVRKTNLEKYGSEYGVQSQVVKSKIKQTNLKKFGFTTNLKHQSNKSKIRQTCLQRYGVQNVAKSQVVKSKIRQTCLQRYDVQNPFQSEKIQIKCRNEFNKKTFFRNLQKWSQFVIPMFSNQDYIGYKQKYKWKCVKCGNQFYSDIYSTGHLNQNRYIPRCLVCYPYLQGNSALQKQFVQFVKENYEYDVKENYCNLIKPYELDVYLHQKCIAIEFDGLAWHSQRFKDKNYHLMKTQMCLQKGIQLIHIFEDEWLYKQEIVKDRIKNILGVYDNRIYARKCIIKEIDFKICNQFLDINHIQGHDNSKIRLGLFYNEELISVMTFSKPRFNRNYEYELVRFASKLGTQVVGGASKLLKYFERNYNPKSIISYADRRYSNGKLYYALGFQFLNNSEPNYFWKLDDKKLTRYQCQKHKLKKLLGQNRFNPQLSESQNMYRNRYLKIYDCGNMVFVK